MNIYENKPFRVFSADYFGGNITSTAGVYYITNKQLLFKSYARTEEDGGRENLSDHSQIIREIDGLIYDDNDMDSKTDRRPYNIYIYMSKDYYSDFMQFVISLPESGHISLSQRIFLCKVLDELDEYNKYVCLAEKKCKYISVFNDDDDDTKYFNVEEARTKISECVTGYQELHLEKIDSDMLEKNGIYGKTLSDDEIEKVIRKYIDFSECNSANDLLRIMKLCDRYYNDSYYRDYFLKVFPNYLEVEHLIKEMKPDNMNVVGISLNNIYDVLSSYYNAGVGYRKR